jgi:hypothetical protein
MALLVSAKVLRSGNVVVFGLTTAAVGTSGYPPVINITAVNTTGLVVYDNGTPVTLGPKVWSDNTNGHPSIGSVVGFRVTSGPIAAGHTVTFDAAADFLASNALQSPAITGGPVTNFAGLPRGTPEGAWGHFPALPTTDRIPVGWNSGQNAVNVDTDTFIGKNRMLSAPGWGVLSGSGVITHDTVGLGFPASWTLPASTVLATSIYSPAGNNFLAGDKGYNNSLGKWTVIYTDSRHGTAGAATVTLTHDSLSNAYASVSLASTSAAGNTVTQIYHVDYSNSNPTVWDLRLKLTVSAPANNDGQSDGTAHWTLGGQGDIWVIAPRAQDGEAAATPDPSRPYAIDDNVLAAWLPGDGSHPLVLRTMESYALDNRIYTNDLLNVARNNWQAQATYAPVAGFVRFLNTNPAHGSGGDNTYPWAETTRIYGPQAMFTVADATTYTLGVTLKAGSNIATITSGTPQLCGSSITAVSGTGSIPTGTLMAQFTATAIAFDAPATADGAATLTLQHPNYIPLNAGDNGLFANGGFGNGWAPVQVRFATPHTLTTGQTVLIDPHSNSVAFTNGIGLSDFGNSVSVRIWVTDAYTVVFSVFVGANGTPTTFTTIDSTSEYDFSASGGWTFTLKIPRSAFGFGYPDECYAAMCAEVGAAFHLNLQDFATDRLYAERARRALSGGGSGLEVRIEYGNELWNGFGNYLLSRIMHQSLNILAGYLATGTTWFHYYTTTHGQRLPYQSGGYANGAGILGAAAAHLVFGDAWAAAGGDDAKIKRLFGSQFAGPAITGDIVAAAQGWGMPIDYILVAPYPSMPQYASMTTAFSPTGGNWPVDDWVDFAGDFFTWNWDSQQNSWAGHVTAITPWGQPPSAITAVNSGGSGSSLAVGHYLVAYTYVASDGGETTIGSSQTPTTVDLAFAGQTITATFPSGIPPWVASINIYLAAANPSNYGIYVNLPATTAAGTAVPMTATPTLHAPPATNGAPGASGPAPEMACYEGLPQCITPANLAAWGPHEHDCRAHPAMRDHIYKFIASLQIGDQSRIDGGAAYANLFQYYMMPIWSQTNQAVWGISWSQGQLPGAGLSNAYATAQGWAATATPGVTPDGADHNAGAPLPTGFAVSQVPNQSTAAMGVWDWMTGPAAAPTVSGTTPAGSATHVSVSGSISVVYSDDMQGGTLTLSLSASGQATIDCTLGGYNSSTFTATWDLPSAMAHGVTYTGTANGTGADSTPMASAYTWTFTTVYLAPAVVSVTPTDGSIGVATDDTITATLTGAVDSGSIVFTFTPSLAGTASLSGGVATFTPTSSMPNLTAYSVSLAASAPDGTAMTPYVWGFTTQAGPPTVTATTPAADATGVGPVAAISATFSEAINPSSLSLTLSPSAMVLGPAWDAGTNTASWTPAGAGLAYATSYTATVSATAADGTTMTAPHEWSFATHDSPPTGHGLLSSTAYRFAGPIDATSMVMTMTGPAGSVSGTPVYDGTNHLITYTTASPMTPGARYLVSISGLKTTGGATIPGITYTHIPGTQKAAGWVGGLGRANGG